MSKEFSATCQLLFDCLFSTKANSFNLGVSRGGFQSNSPISSIRTYFSRAPQAMASPQVKNYRRVPLLDHEIHGALAPRSPARMPNIARTIQVTFSLEHVPIALRICNACGSTKLYACAQCYVARNAYGLCFARRRLGFMCE